jgi:hypothetical protein
MGLRLTLALSLISGATQLVVFWRLYALGLVLRYWYFSLYVLCGALQCTGWLMGPRDSNPYAAFWLFTTPVMIGLRVAVVAELWNLFQSQYNGNRVSRRIALGAVVLAVAVSLATGIDLWRAGWHPTVFRLFSLAIRYSASTLAILCALVTWAGHASGRALPANLVRHAFLLTGYFTSLAAGHLVAHLSDGDNVIAGLIMSFSAVAFLSLWPILLTRDGESVIARGGDDPPIHGAVSDLGRR